jgi:hypothetical protein
MEMVIEVSHPHPPTNPGRMSKLKHLDFAVVVVLVSLLD